MFYLKMKAGAILLSSKAIVRFILEQQMLQEVVSLPEGVEMVMPGIISKWL